MKFRSLLYIVIALASLGLSVLLAKPYGGYGCAFATSLALFLGQGLIMNIYYHRKQHIDMVKFWKEIIQMSLVPVCFVAAGLLVTNSAAFSTVTILNFVGFGLLFTIAYGFAFWYLGMNKDEKQLISQPVGSLIARIRR